MRDEDKTNKQLTEELGDLRQRIAELEAAEVERIQAEEALRQSEVRYRAVVEQSPDGIFLDDVETRCILEANEALQKLLGYSAEEIQGLTIYDIIAADRENIDQRFEKILGTEGPFTHERQYRRKDGSLVDVWVSAKVISYAGRRATCVLVRDLTERKRAEEEVWQSEERYRAVMEQSADGIYLVDVETKHLLEANPAFAQMLGYTAEEIRGLSVHDIVAAEQEAIDQRFQERVNGKGPSSFERQYRKKDGSLVEVWVSFSLISYGGRKVMCALVRDLTKRKRAEQEREKLIAELQEALNNIRTLRGLVPICAQCKKIRDDKGYWQQVEAYIHAHSEAEFSHGLCPDCAKKFLADLKKDGRPSKD